MRRIKYIIYCIVILSCILLLGNSSIDRNSYIENVLNTTYYSSLPDSVKELIKDSYIESGNVIKVEENKEENVPYLNPEYISYLSLSEEEKNNIEVIPNMYKTDFGSLINTNIDGLPSYYDARDVNGNNYVTPLRNQGSLSICWAFSAAETAESYVMKTTNSTYNAYESLIFAERQIDYATANDVINNYTSPYKSISRSLGGGGNFYIASYPLAAGISLYSADNFKEFDEGTNSMEMSDIFTIADSEYELNSSIDSITNPYRESTSTLTSEEKEIRTNYINVVKQSIIDYGSAYVSTYFDTSCGFLNSDGEYVIDVYNCDYTNKGHAMQIIGWDDNYTYSYCDNSAVVRSKNTSGCSNVVTGKGVWILRNSWGEYYSYPLLAYDSKDSNISIITGLSKTEDRNWDNNYSAGDGNYLFTSYTTNMSDTAIKGEEELKKIKFVEFTAASTYTVNILESDGNITTLTASSTYPGLVTIDVPEGVIVNSSSTITIKTSGGSITNKILTFTKNIDKTPYIDLPSFGEELTETNKVLYSTTKNIDSGSFLEYRLFTSEEDEVTDYISISNNMVAMNNINTYFSIDTSSLVSDRYELAVYYDDEKIASTYLNYYDLYGSGTEDDPYLIHNIFEYAYIYDHPSSHYRLENDLDFEYATLNENGLFYNDGFGYKGISNFSGTFDGNYYTISNLYQQNYTEEGNTRTESNGLFYSLKGNAVIKNLTLYYFDIRCSSGYCGSLFSVYNGASSSDNTLIISNIALQNGYLVASDTDNETYIGGLYGTINDLSGSVSISNIYNDTWVDCTGIGSGGFFAYELSHGSTNPSVNISNIELLGEIYIDNEFLINGFDYATKTAQNINVTNVLSTLYNDSFNSFTSDSIDSTFNFRNANIVNSGTNYLDNLPNDVTIKSINAEDIETFTLEDAYSTWEDFDDNWILEYESLPNLSFVDFEYAFVDLTMEVGSDYYYSIYELIDCYNYAAYRILYSGYDTNIMEIDENGFIKPIDVGQTTVTIKSLYDGFVGDVTIIITSHARFENPPKRNITFYSNNGLNTSKNQEISIGVETKLNENTFTYDEYYFIEWNTSSDGSGISYYDEEYVTLYEDTDLYAIWTPICVTITFYSNNGLNVSKTQTIASFESTALSKNTFTYDNYYFVEWNTSSDGSGISYEDNELVILDSDISLYAIWHESFAYVLNNLNYDETNNIIYNLHVNNTFESLMSSITLNDKYSINKESAYSILNTGAKINILKDGNITNTFVISVLGDINGDAKVNSADYVKVRKHIMGSENISDLVIFKSADVNKDNKISSADYVKIRKYIMNGEEL